MRVRAQFLGQGRKWGLTLIGKPDPIGEANRAGMSSV